MTEQEQLSKQSASENRVSGALIAFLLILAVYMGIAWKYVHTGHINADEGFYCLAAKKAIEGRLPYRDFAYSQMPVHPYINGLMMKIVGFGYLEQRAVNAVWGILTLVAAFYLGLCIGHRYAGLAAAWLTATSIYWVHFVCMGKTYAATGFFLMIAALSISVPWSYYKKVLIFTLATVLAIGCRLTVAPVILVLGVFLILQADKIKDRIIAALLPILAVTALFLLFFLADRENFTFWNFTYHLGTSFNRRGWLTIKEHLWLAPGVLLVMIAGIVTVITRFKQLKVKQLGVFLAAIVGIAAQLGLKSSYGENSVPYVALGAVGATAILSKWKWPRKLCPIVLLFSLLAWPGPKPMTQDYMPDALLNTAKFVQDHTTPDDKILTIFPIIAIEARRDVFEGLEMGKFALTSEMPEEKARRLHLVTPRVLTELVKAKEPAAVVLTALPSPWNFYWSVPSLQPANKQQRHLFFQTLGQNYHSAFTEHLFVVFLPNPPR